MYNNFMVGDSVGFLTKDDLLYTILHIAPDERLALCEEKDGRIQQLPLLLLEKKALSITDVTPAPAALKEGNADWVYISNNNPDVYHHVCCSYLYNSQQSITKMTRNEAVNTLCKSPCKLCRK